MIIALITWNSWCPMSPGLARTGGEGELPPILENFRFSTAELKTKFSVLRFSCDFWSDFDGLPLPNLENRTTPLPKYWRFAPALHLSSWMMCASFVDIYVTCKCYRWHLLLLSIEIVLQCKSALEWNSPLTSLGLIKNRSLLAQSGKSITRCSSSRESLAQETSEPVLWHQPIERWALIERRCSFLFSYFSPRCWSNLLVSSEKNLLCVSIHNPSLNPDGSACCYFLISFWHFCFATLIDKAEGKITVQSVFVIVLTLISTTIRRLVARTERTDAPHISWKSWERAYSRFDLIPMIQRISLVDGFVLSSFDCELLGSTLSQTTPVGICLKCICVGVKAWMTTSNQVESFKHCNA